MGQTRVDLLHLLEDLRDAYPGSLEETVLTEIVANALDSGASLIRIAADAASASLTIADNGSGMQRRELARYHDLATSTKARGRGIGFAGVGIKLGLLACKDVVTETRRGKSHVASQWHLASRHKAPWRWVPPPGMVTERGTAVRLALSDPLSPLVDRGFVEAAIRRHYQPLLDPAFDGVLSALYPRGVAFEVNGAVMQKLACEVPEIGPLAIYPRRKRKPSAAGYLVRDSVPLPEDQRGLAISTYGKVIKRGWDWLGITPNAPERIGGVIEVPMLAASLTLNKGDFIRSGQRGAAYLTVRKAIQEVVLHQLAAWGDSREQPEKARPRSLRVLERDLERVLMDLSDGFPLLASLVEHRRGGQKRLPLGQQARAGDGFGVSPAGPGARSNHTGENGPPPAASPDHVAAEPPPQNPEAIPPPEPEAEPPAHGLELPAAQRERRPARLGLAVQFEERPGDPELGRLVESTVLINQAHPAYQRAAASRSEGYHIALSVALALAPLAVEPAKEHAFVTAFLSRWGEALSAARRPRRKKA
ncbi:MAG: ATP-binding protein [Betaproteobacteria bacterium]|nr:ATP-binding protein [Betaproteobacteria bacterium]